MKAIITIQMDNAAFEEDVEGLELITIFNRLSEKIARGLDIGDSFTLKDSNGNTVGRMVIKK